MNEGSGLQVKHALKLIARAQSVSKFVLAAVVAC
jgi:hypothetical protein